jgi:hypothetical protein
MNKSAFELSCKFPLVNSAKAKWQEVARKLMTIEPVLDAQVDLRGILSIRYDASTIGMHDIETLLNELGVPRKTNAWWKLKLAWFRYVDENAQANAHASGGACCNRPPSVYGGSAQTGKANQWHFPK